MKSVSAKTIVGSIIAFGVSLTVAIVFRERLPRLMIPWWLIIVLTALMVIAAFGLPSRPKS